MHTNLPNCYRGPISTLISILKGHLHSHISSTNQPDLKLHLRPLLGFLPALLFPSADPGQTPQSYTSLQAVTLPPAVGSELSSGDTMEDDDGWRWIKRRRA